MLPLGTPFRTRFRFGSAYHWLNLTTQGNSPARSTKSTPSLCLGKIAPTLHRALTACKRMVSGSISFPSRGAFHLSLTVLVRYRSLGYLALESGLPSFPPGSSCLVVLRILRVVLSSFGYGTVTPSGRPFHARSPRRKFCNYLRLLPCLTQSFNPHYATPAGYHTRTEFGLLPVRSPLLRELSLFFGVLRCFSSPTCLLHL